MTNDELELSRRKVLAGLGTAGVAAAGAGLGTTAYLNDQESFDGNMMTAGTLDLRVEYVVHEDQGSAGTYTINSYDRTINGTAVNGTINGNASDVPALNGEGTAMSVTLDDVKPGDSGYARFCFDIVDNPAYIWAQGALTDSSENGYTEPEPEDDNGEGELEEAIELDVKYCDINHRGNLAGENPMQDTITAGSLGDVLGELDDGIKLYGRRKADGAFLASAPTSGNPCVCFEWKVPTSVGNEIQGDSVTFDLGFYAEQARHNDDPTYTPA